MPITLPRRLPAFSILKSEGVMVMSRRGAASQEIRPLSIGLLNLMPKKIQTETQFARMIGATPLQIDLTLIRMSDHHSKHTSSDHMEAFYQPFSEVKHRKFDGLIITGAPVEHLDFPDVTYWSELREVFDWTQTHVHSTFGVCWGGMAMINYFHGIEKHLLAHKAFGCFTHDVQNAASPYLLGCCDTMTIPVSRWTEMRREEITRHAGLEILIDSEESGPCLVTDPAHRALYIFNHLEYDSTTLKEEYDRDIANGTPINIPCNYYPKDDPSQPPRNSWRAHGHLIYGNWLNEIYQSTPYDIARIGTGHFEDHRG